MISWVALDRIVETERASDAAYRKQAGDKVLRSDAQRLTDAELVAKLSSYGIELDRPSLERLCGQALSAEEIAQPLLDQRTFRGRPEQMQSDWIWICLSALWQRWFPDKPSFEALDDKMQAGMICGHPAPWRLAGCGWRRGAMCCASWTRPACGRFKSSTIGSKGANRCLTGFRIWKTSCGRRGWRIGSFSARGSRSAKRGCGVFALTTTW